jgi:hypothetical protein
MWSCASGPVTDKLVDEATTKELGYAVVAMQGWRPTMEDKHGECGKKPSTKQELTVLGLCKRFIPCSHHYEPFPILANSTKVFDRPNGSLKPLTLHKFCLHFFFFDSRGNVGWKEWAVCCL